MSVKYLTRRITACRHQLFYTGFYRGVQCCSGERWFPQLKEMLENWLHLTPHVKWSDRECVSASSIASLPLSSPVQFMMVGRSYNEQHDIKTRLQIQCQRTWCWRSPSVLTVSLSLLYPTNYSLNFAVLHRGDDFCRQVFQRQCAQVHRLCARTSLFSVPQWKSAKKQTEHWVSFPI